MQDDLESCPSTGKLNMTYIIFTGLLLHAVFASTVVDITRVPFNGTQPLS